LYQQKVIKESDAFNLNDLPSLSYQKLQDLLVNTLKSLGDSIRIIIDAIDQLPDGDPARNLQWLFSNAPVLLSSLNEKQKKIFRSLCPGSKIVQVSELDYEKSKALLYLWFLSTRSGARKLKEEQLNALMKEYNHRPLHLRVLYERAVYLRSFDGIPEWLGGDRLPTEDAIFDLYNHLAKEEVHGQVMLERVLAYLAATPYGLPEAVLLELLRKDDVVVNAFRTRSPNSPDVGKDRLPEVVWSRLHHDLEPFLARRAFFGEEYIGFYHAQFIRVITDEVKPWVNANVMRDCRENIELLANNIENMQRSCMVNEAQISLTLRRFLYRHGMDNAMQLGEAALINTARRLTNFSYLMARLESVAVSELSKLLDEYQLLEKHRPEFSYGEIKWSDWSMFVEGNAHLLSLGDEMWPANRILLQLGIEHADDSPITIQADKWLAENGNCDWLWKRASVRPKYYAPSLCRYVLKSAITMIISENSRLLSFNDGVLSLWDLKLGSKMQESLAKDVDKFKEIDSQRVLLIGPQSLIVWNHEQWICECTLQIPSAFKDVVLISQSRVLLTYPLLFTRDWEIVNNYYFNIEIWSLQSGALENTLKHKAPVEGVKVLSGEKVISWCSDSDGPNTYEDCSVYIWNPDTGECLNTLHGYQGSIENSFPLGGCKMIITSATYSEKSSRENSVYVWNGKGDTFKHSLSISSSPVHGFQDVDGDFGLAWGESKNIRLCHIASGNVMRCFDGHTRKVQGVALLPDRMFLSWSSDSSLKIWNLDSGCCLRTLSGHVGAVIGASCCVSSNWILSWSADHVLRLWDMKTGECLAVLNGHTTPIVEAHILAKEQIISWSKDEEVRFWDVSAQVAKRSLVQEPQSKVKGSLMLSGEHALVWTDSDQIQCWNLESGECEYEVQAICPIEKMIRVNTYIERLADQRK